MQRNFIVPDDYEDIFKNLKFDDNNSQGSSDIIMARDFLYRAGIIAKNTEVNHDYFLGCCINYITNHGDNIPKSLLINLCKLSVNIKYAMWGNQADKQILLLLEIILKEEPDNLTALVRAAIFNHALGNNDKAAQQAMHCLSLINLTNPSSAQPSQFSLFHMRNILALDCYRRGDMDGVISHGEEYFYSPKKSISYGGENKFSSLIGLAYLKKQDYDRLNRLIILIPNMDWISIARFKAETALFRDKLSEITGGDLRYTFSSMIEYEHLGADKKNEDFIRGCQIYVLACLQDHRVIESTLSVKLFEKALHYIKEANPDGAMTKLGLGCDSIVKNKLFMPNHYFAEAQMLIKAQNTFNIDILELSLDILRFKNYKLVGEVNDAALLAEKIVATNHEWYEVKMVALWLDVQRKDYRKVLSSLNSVDADHPSDLDALLAEAYHGLGMYAEAFNSAMRFYENDTSKNVHIRLKVNEILIASQIENLKSLLAENSSVSNERYVKSMLASNSMFAKKSSEVNGRSEFGRQSSCRPYK